MAVAACICQYECMSCLLNTRTDISNVAPGACGKYAMPKAVWYPETRFEILTGPPQSSRLARQRSHDHKYLGHYFE